MEIYSKDFFYKKAYSQIEIDYQFEYKNLLIKFLEVCLNVFKPNFELEINENNNQIKLNYDGYFMSLNAFDKVKNVKKQLIVFEGKMKTEINYYTKLSKQFLRKDLIYQIYDSYYLDNKQNFYIFELEYPEESFFSQLNNYQDQPVFKSAIEKLKEFFSEQFLDLGDYFPIFCINNLKINLFDLCKYQKYFFNKITNISKKQRYKVKEQFDLQALNQIPICLHFTQFQEFQPKQKQQITNQGQIMLVEYDNNQQEQENENLQDDISQDSVEDELQLQLQLDEEFNQEQYILNQINSFKNAIFLKIKKENLLEKIKEFYSDILQYHSEQLFLLIQQHPKYDYFQVLSYDIDYVELKILQNKTWKTLLIKKFNCFQKAQDEENLINLQANIIQNAINTEIIVLEKHFYLLTEYKYFRNQFQKYPSLEDLLTIFRGQSKNKLFIYQLLVEISYQLFTKFNIRLTNICPSKIIVFGCQENFQKEQKFEVAIKKINSERFDEQYSNLIKSEIEEEEINLQKQSECKFETLLIQHLNDLIDKPKQEILKQYLDIKEQINLLKFSIDYDRIYILPNNKLRKICEYDSQYLELIKYQQLVVSLQATLHEISIQNTDFRHLKGDIFDEWKQLDNIQLEQFQLHYQKLSTYLQSSNLNNHEDSLFQSSIQFNNQLTNDHAQSETSNSYLFQIIGGYQFDSQNEISVLTELKNLLEIIQPNIPNFSIDIVQNNLDFQKEFKYQDQDYSIIQQQLKSKIQKILKIKMDNTFEDEDEDERGFEFKIATLNYPVLSDLASDKLIFFNFIVEKR